MINDFTFGVADAATFTERVVIRTVVGIVIVGAGLAILRHFLRRN